MKNVRRDPAAVYQASATGSIRNRIVSDEINEFLAAPRASSGKSGWQRKRKERLYRDFNGVRVRSFVLTGAPTI